MANNPAGFSPLCRQDVPEMDPSGEWIMRRFVSYNEEQSYEHQHDILLSFYESFNKEIGAIRLSTDIDAALKARVEEFHFAAFVELDSHRVKPGKAATAQLANVRRLVIMARELIKDVDTRRGYDRVKNLFH